MLKIIKLFIKSVLQDIIYRHLWKISLSSREMIEREEG